MTQTIDEKLPAYHNGWALFLDIDGTLVDFVEDPDGLKASSEISNVLEELYRLTRGALALVSGRTIASVDVIFEPLRLPTAGLHGHERRDSLGRMQRARVEDRPLSAARASFTELVDRYPGAFIEDKGLAFALHYRRVPGATEDVEKLARKMEATLPEPFCVQRGKMVIEIRPCTYSKGSAIEAFMNEAPFNGRTPVFVGDDATDEYGFRWVHEHGGVSIKVGAGATSAHYRIGDVARVVRWLEDYAAFLQRAEGEVDCVS